MAAAIAPELCIAPERRPDTLDEQTERLLHHLHENAPELSIAGELARRFAAVIRGDDDAGLEQWIADATGSELASLAAGIGRDIALCEAMSRPTMRFVPVKTAKQQAALMLVARLPKIMA
ncbi:hypothetical protein NKJ26_32290 [Mesorhizobium sp. M0152]|uniref:hypothetical protein n=1 Tax=Mesorhizobium sp. M0152 TaxID=2956898 RepID=UPI0033352894